MINGWGILAIIFFVASLVLSIFASHEKGIVFAVTAFVSMASFVATLAMAIILPIMARRDISYYKSIDLAVSVGSAVLGNDEFEEIVAETNAWLEDAKDSLNTYGIFSRYYGTDLDELEYIVLE